MISLTVDAVEFSAAWVRTVGSKTALGAHLLMPALGLMVAVLLAIEASQWAWSVLLHCDIQVAAGFDAPWQVTC